MIESHDLCQMMTNETYHKINSVKRQTKPIHSSHHKELVLFIWMHSVYCSNNNNNNNSLIHWIEYCQLFGSHLEFHFMSFITINLMHKILFSIRNQNCIQLNFQLHLHQHQQHTYNIQHCLLPIHILFHRALECHMMGLYTVICQCLPIYSCVVSS